MPELRRRLSAGQLVFREGDAPTHAYVVESGTIEVSTNHGGEHVVLALLGPGDLFGEMAMIDSAPRTATARALGEAAVIEIDRTQIQQRLESADPIVSALLRRQLQHYRGVLRRLGDARDDASLDLALPQPEPSSAADAGAIGTMRLESELRYAIERRQLEVRFQPILSLAERRIAGYEALIRWTHPERGPISPIEFIPVAEQTSLIVPLGRYVMDEAARLVAGLQSAGDRALPFVAVNVSGRQLVEGDVVADLAASASRHGIALDRLKLEITESLTLDIEHTVTFLARCHDAGVRVSLDDFGTGYSNLGQLHRMAFDTIKLDQSLVRPMLASPRAMHIVAAVVAMAKALGAELVAEGVERAEERDQLARMGCDYAQGYLIGKPAEHGAVLAGTGSIAGAHSR
jgi:EAL domain-containing protein (putative c-di-GMP-specific phosphodiesterase class I)